MTRSSVCLSWNEHLTTVGLKDHSSSHTHTHPEHVWHEGTSNVITQHLKGNVTSMRRRSPVDVWGTHWRRFIDTAHTSGLDWLERAVGQASPDWWWLLQQWTWLELREPALIRHLRGALCATVPPPWLRLVGWLKKKWAGGGFMMCVSVRLWRWFFLFFESLRY